MIMQHTEQEIIEHCAQLLWGYNWAQSNHYDVSVEKYYDGEHFLFIPIGLSDEDKLLCSIFVKQRFILCYVTLNVLKRMFGWSRYKSLKVINNLPFLETLILYYGKGWDFNFEFKDKIKSLQKQDKKCLGCAKIKKCHSGHSWRLCPISKKHELFTTSELFNSTCCDIVKLEITEQFNNFWK
jgi:hypothetical protein